MPVRAKFKVEEVTFTKDGGRIILLPVTGGCPENDAFFKWTPYGKIEIGTINAVAIHQFNAGDEFYVDLTKATSLESYQERVIAEKAELDEKIEKLRAFFTTPLYGGLDSAEQDRLSRQFGFMCSYSAVLEERVSAFS